MSIISQYLKSVPIPEMVRIRQRFSRDCIDNLPEAVDHQIGRPEIRATIRKGDNIAIAVGSRGIANLPAIVRQIVQGIKCFGGEPFIVPAMGSHGGATAGGQKRILETLGVTEQAVGAPVKSSMDVVLVGETDGGLPVYLDRHASDADGMVVVNRVKPHVGFRGDHECGLVKMIAVGLGKQKGAEACHGSGFGRMAGNIVDAARMTISKRNVCFGVAILENAYNETCKVAFLRPDEIFSAEPDLLRETGALSPKLPFQRFDVLVIDEIGKNIAGTGLDTNVAGRYHTPYASGGPEITKIVVLDLTDESHGNANGIGIADFTTRRLYEKINFEQTYLNSLTSTVQNSIKIPMVLGNDRLAVSAAIQTCNVKDRKDVRMVRIRNTKSLESMYVSGALLGEVADKTDLTVDGPLSPLAFGPDGNLSGV